QIIGELADADSYHQRTRVRFDALGETLDAWGKGDTGAQAVVARLRTRMHEICVPAQSDARARAACLEWLDEQA
ncbi:MAG: hypothetical protein SXG53_25515, partial [Pseudomonadota bacterium]|nr:hypothetical protein [Pseudomonadota bacterium]